MASKKIFRQERKLRLNQDPRFVARKNRLADLLSERRVGKQLESHSQKDNYIAALSDSKTELQYKCDF